MIGVDRVVAHQLDARVEAQLVADARQDEILARLAVGTAFEPDDAEPRHREFLGENAAGETHPDHDGIDFR